MQRVLREKGPDGLSIDASELDAMPGWEKLSTPYSLEVAVDFLPGYHRVKLEVQPEQGIIILDFD